MSLSVSLTTPKKVITQPEQSVTFSGEVQIQRIVDIPSEKLVFAFVEGLGRIQLDDLSGDNYDTPAEWTNADVVAAVKKYLG
tara:strand:+ start:4145 stop:4390 length:246 start_codon:yes stop_codon:yes gene_type:complete